MANSKIILISLDNRAFIVDQNVAKISEVLKHFLENLDSAGDKFDAEDPIPVQIDDDILDKVLKWMEYEYNRRQVGRIGGIRDQNIKLGKSFWNVDLENLNAVAKAAIYLDIAGLQETAHLLIKKRLREQLDPQLHRIFASLVRRN